MVSTQSAVAQPSRGTLSRSGLTNWVKACKPPAKYYSTTAGALQEYARLWAVYYEKKARKQKPNSRPKQSRKTYYEKGNETIAITKAEFKRPFFGIYLKHFPATYTWHSADCYAIGGSKGCRKEAKFWSTFDSRYTNASLEVQSECRLARKQLEASIADEKRKKEREAAAAAAAAAERKEAERIAAEKRATEKIAAEKKRREEYAREHERRAAEMRKNEQALIESGSSTASSNESDKKGGLTLSASGSSKAGDKEEGDDKEGEGEGKGDKEQEAAGSSSDSGGTWGAAASRANPRSATSPPEKPSRDKKEGGGAGGGVAAVDPSALGQMASMALAVGAVLGITYVLVKLGKLGGGASLNVRSNYGIGQENIADSLLGGECPDGLSCGQDGLAGGSVTASLLVGDWLVAGWDIGLGWSASPGSMVTVSSQHPLSATQYAEPVMQTLELGGGTYGLFGFSGGVGHIDSWLVRGGANFGVGFDSASISHRDVYASLRYAITDNIAVDVRATFLWQDRYDIDFGNRVECDVVGTGNQCLESTHTLQMGAMTSDDLSDAGLVKYPFTIGVGLELFRSHGKRKGPGK